MGGEGGSQQWVEVAGHLLHHHLRHSVEGGEAGVGEALLVLPHLDGLQPLVHRVKAGVVGDRAVQQRQVDSRGWWATGTVSARADLGVRVSVGVGTGAGCVCLHMCTHV